MSVKHTGLCSSPRLWCRRLVWVCECARVLSRDWLATRVSADLTLLSCQRPPISFAAETPLTRLGREAGEAVAFRSAGFRLSLAAEVAGQGCPQVLVRRS